MHVLRGRKATAQRRCGASDGRDYRQFQLNRPGHGGLPGLAANSSLDLVGERAFDSEPNPRQPPVRLVDWVIPVAMCSFRRSESPLRGEGPNTNSTTAPFGVRTGGRPRIAECQRIDLARRDFASNVANDQQLSVGTG